MVPGPSRREPDLGIHLEGAALEQLGEHAREVDVLQRLPDFEAQPLQEFLARAVALRDHEIRPVAGDGVAQRLADRLLGQEEAREADREHPADQFGYGGQARRRRSSGLPRGERPGGSSSCFLRSVVME